MKCPSCGGLDVRTSKRTPRFSFLHQIRGYERYRCRECRRAFWEKPPVNLEERDRRKRQRGWSHTLRTQGRRRTVEVAIFFTMLLIFVLTIRYLINKGDTASSPSGFLFPIPSPKEDLLPPLNAGPWRLPTVRPGYTGYLG